MIDDFEEKFFPIKKHKPQKGQVLVKFTAYAELINDFPKEPIVNLLLNSPKGGEMAAQILRNVCNASEREALRLAREMAVDLTNMTKQEVLEKPYEFLLEIFYWAKEEDVPKDSPHWETIKIINDFSKETPYIST